jgi:hypothetical protein
MSSSQSNEKGFNPSMKDSFNILYVLAKGHAMCFLPFFRRNFGSEALGWPGFTAFILMLLVGSFGRIPELMGFMGIWIVVMLGQRASTMRAMRQGVVRHSRYEGDVDTKLCRNRSTMKRVVEPLVCVLAGVCIETAGISHGLAMFVGMGFFSLSVVAGIDRQLDQKRVQAMRDAAIEQSYLARRFSGEIEDP